MSEEFYFEDLFDALKARELRGQRVLYVGHSKGEEIRTMSAVGCHTTWCVTSPQRDLKVEGQLFNDRIDFDGPFNFWDNREDWTYVVLSGDIDSECTVVNRVTDLIGDCGYLFFPEYNSTLHEEVEACNMIRLDSHRRDCAVYLKHDAIAEDWE